MFLGSVETPHGFLCNSCSCEKNFHKLCSGIFGLLSPSSQIVAAHLGLGTNILATRKHWSKKNVHRILLCSYCATFVYSRFVQLHCTFGWECHLTLLTIIYKLTRKMFGLHMIPHICFTLVGKLVTQATHIFRPWVRHQTARTIFHYKLQKVFGVCHWNTCQQQNKSRIIH